MARRILNRMEKRSEYEAYEATQRPKNEDDADDLDDEEEDDDADEAEASDSETDADDGDEEAAPPKKRQPARQSKTRPRSRAAKVPRMKVVWGVFNNANQRIATFDYPKRQEAEEHAARMKAEKNATFFIQPVKEPLEDKKEG
jgi:hypothetical protein